MSGGEAEGAAAALAGLNARQREAAGAPPGPLLVLAGPGSGKTRVLTSRIAWLAAGGRRPQEILAIAFTNKAAEEIRARLAPLAGAEPTAAVWVGTFHRLCARILRVHPQAVGRSARFSIFDAEDARRTLARLMSPAERALASPAEAAAAIGRAKNRLVDCAELAAWAVTPAERAIAAVWERYEHELRASDSLDLDDLLVLAARLLEADPALRRAYAERHAEVLVDEYQDTNAAQLALLRALCAGHRRLTAVGDEDQGIYRFRGAELDNVLAFERHFPGARVLGLEQCYRQSPQILEAASRLIARNALRRSKRLWTQNPAGTRVEIRVFADARAEARFVAGALAEFGEDAVAPTAAVLYRSHALRRDLEPALSAAGVAYRVIGGRALFEQAVVRDALAYLRLLSNPRDREAFLRAVAAPRRAVGRAAEALVRFAEAQGLTLIEACGRAAELPGASARQRSALCRFGAELGALAGRARTEPASALLVAAITLPGGLADHLRARCGADRQAARELERLRELVRAAAERERAGAPAGLQAFLEQAQLAAGADEEDAAGARVTLASIHASKGLEFDQVFVVGVEAGTLPSPHARAPEEIEEERRLLYVAITRARQRLVVSGVRVRGGRARGRSPFLDELAAAPLRRAA